MAIPALVRRHGIIVGVATIILLPLLIFTLWAAVTLHFTYSHGTRAGYLQKISDRGWICKTWEGELLLSSVPGSVPDKFTFTVRSDSIANELSRLNGQHVMVEYAQHKGVPGSCFGETEYFITGVRVVP